MIQDRQREDDRLLRNVLLTFFIGGACAQPLGSFIPFLRQAHGLSYDFSGYLLSAQSVGNVVAVLLSGFLPAYIGRRKTILAMAFWMIPGLLVFSGGLGAPTLLLAACFFTGLTRGGNANFSNTMISTLPPEKSVLGYNLLHGAFALGALLSPLLLVYASGRSPELGWRMVAGGLCALAVVQVVIYARMRLPAEPEKKGGQNLDKSFLKMKLFWLSSAMLFFYLSAEYGVCGWMVTYFQDMGLLSAEASQMMNSLYWLVICFGRVGGAFLTGKIPRTRLLLADGVGMSVCFFVMLLSTSPLPIILGLAGAALFMATVYPTVFAFGNEAIAGNDLGCSTMLLIASAGGILTPALMGVVAEGAGIRSGMLLVAADVALLLCSIIISVLSVRAGRGNTKGV